MWYNQCYFSAGVQILIILTFYFSVYKFDFNRNIQRNVDSEQPHDQLCIHFHTSHTAHDYIVCYFLFIVIYIHSLLQEQTDQPANARTYVCIVSAKQGHVLTLRFFINETSCFSLMFQSFSFRTAFKSKMKDLEADRMSMVLACLIGKLK